MVEGLETNFLGKKNSFQDKLFALTIRTETRLQRSVAPAAETS